MPVVETLENLTDVSLPEDLMIQLSQAVESHSITDLRSSLSAIGERGPKEEALANHLSDLASRYDIEALKKVLSRLGDGKHA